MSAGWVAGSVRARGMIRRRLGSAAVRDLAAHPSLEAALQVLARTPYGHDVRSDQSLAEAQRATVACVAWNLRVLAGWVPRGGVRILRLLVGSMEIHNVEGHLQRLAGATPGAPYQLGGVATAWPRLDRTTSSGELRQVLAASPWGDPGSEDPRDVILAMRLSLADRTMAAVPAARPWAAGAAALLLARELLLHRRELPERARIDAARVLGPAALSAATLDELASVLPTGARWALADVDDPQQLWLAEARWWRRVETDGFALARRPTPGPEVLVGAVAAMATDAWRVRAALEIAARGGPSLEAFDAVA